MSDFTIKHGLEDGDLERVFAIEKECFNPGYRWVSSQLDMVRKDLDFWLAFSPANEMLGFLAGQENWGYGHIENVAVLKPYRSKGVASALIEAATTYYKFRGLKKSDLHVYVENPALILYFKLGYRPYTISRGEDHRTMRMVKVL
jgi:ribosomal protein S18 acetylase RimI-like enzyme